MDNSHQISIDHQNWFLSIRESDKPICCLCYATDVVVNISGKSERILKKLLTAESLTSEEIQLIQSFPFVKASKPCQKLTLDGLLENHLDFTEVKFDEMPIEAYANELNFSKDYSYRTT